MFQSGICILFLVLVPEFAQASFFSEDLQKCHIKWQYVRKGKINVLYSNTFHGKTIGVLMNIGYEIKQFIIYVLRCTR